MLNPIPKDKRKSKSDSENYRGIALSSFLGKILDWIILIENSDQLSTSDLQFGFESNSSTVQCTYTLLECVNYYSLMTPILTLFFLDASKAFDRVNYVKLFKCLLKRGVSPVTCRLLLKLYTKQKCRSCDKMLLQNLFGVAMESSRVLFFLQYYLVFTFMS